MFLSMNWVSDFVDLSGLDLKNLIHRFTLSTAEVEEVIVKGADVQGVIVAEILSVDNHPTSKKLHLLKVNTGKETLDIVCGAPNVRPGMRVALAVDGSVVGGHTISPATVGGYTSYGMCCSEAELGISADNSGLFEITDDIPLGTDLKSVYDIDDVIFEVDNKSLSNRPDLWGHYGIAREFATLTGRPLRAPETVNLALYNDLPAVAVDVRDPLCFRYSAIKVENVQKHTSPVNMRIRLFYCGSRALNLLADLTNYVMMELGQPMHAFDLRRVEQIEVQRFTAPFSFDTLDGTARNIDDSMLMICANETPVAVAGVMGGLASEIEDDTTSLLLESATFDGVSIRKTSARLGLRTDASIRYEKFLDPELVPLASARFLSLLFKIDAGARAISSFTDVYNKRYDTVTIALNQAYIDRYTGISISQEQVVSTLTALGFKVKTDKESYTVTVPSWRATKDVTIKADLIEEITRIYGYDNFEISTTKSPLFPIRKPMQKRVEDKAKDLLVSAFRLHEVHSYIWCDREKYKAIGIDVPENVKVINAQTPEHAVLRRSMIPTLLAFVAENRDFGEEFGIFEIGHVVEGLNENQLCNERKKLGIVLYDRQNSEEELYLRARDIAEYLTKDLLHKAPVFTPVKSNAPAPYLHPVNTATVSVDGAYVGYIGVPHPAVKMKLDKKASIAVLELDTAFLSESGASVLSYREPSRFPEIAIDLSFVLSSEDILYSDLEACFRDCGGDLLREISVIDIFDGKDSAGSITFRFVFSSPERTLSKAELQPILDKIIGEMAAHGYALKM